MEPIADKTFDFRGAILWLALLKFIRIFRGMAPNQIIEIKGMDPDARGDLLKVLPENSYELLVVEEDVDASYRLYLRKRDIQLSNFNCEKE